MSKELIRQEYPGPEDIDNHFYTMLPAFKDKRYFKLHGKLLFLIYSPMDIPDFSYFKERWNMLAKDNGLSGFYFIANSEDITDLNKEELKKYDAISLCRLYAPWKIEYGKIKLYWMYFRKVISLILGYSLNVVSYNKAINLIDSSFYENEKVYPNIIPAWDNSPRRGPVAYIYKESTPSLFKKHVSMILNRIRNKSDEDKVVFLKSWNEWAEGNYIEPDLKWGKKYINALKEAIDEF